MRVADDQSDRQVEYSMAWNEPGGGKDPWSGKGGDQGPPDLDEVVKKLQEKFGGLFGGMKSSKGGPSSDDGSGPGSKTVSVLLIIGLLVWLASGFYIVQPAERGVVLRFGAY
jgi:membrane protease subunit HflK